MMFVVFFHRKPVSRKNTSNQEYTTTSENIFKLSKNSNYKLNTKNIDNKGYLNTKPDNNILMYSST
ncbi:hypothetical protein NP565_24675, partial [Vibrio parahaemolyticus]|nr:hypothetical protein [Vibrio parahaemolyticus]